MLCAKYDYKMDIAVKQEEAREEGKEEGIAIGIKYATENAVKNCYENGVSIPVIAKSLNITTERVQEILATP